MEEPAPTMKKVSSFDFSVQWKTYLTILWMALITAFLFHINARIGALGEMAKAIESRDDAIESVVLSTDKVVTNIESKVAGVESNVAYIVQKVRRK
jgi:hypothetical protein